MNVIEFPVWLVRPPNLARVSWLKAVLSMPCMDKIPSLDMCDCVGRDMKGSITCLDCDDNPLGQK